MLQAFSSRYGIQARDVGLGRFHSQHGPSGEPVSGICIYDNANGSLRLTERLVANFGEVLAIATSANQQNPLLAAGLAELSQLVAELTSGQIVGLGSRPEPTAPDQHWVKVVAKGSRAMLMSSRGSEEVTVLDHFYTPDGVQYHLAHPQPTVRWLIRADVLEPIHGVTDTCRFNVMTGETQPELNVLASQLAA